MSRCAGLSLVLVACASGPDAHFEVTRAAGEVTVQLCEPGTAVGCKTSDLFTEEPAAAVKTLEIFLDDATTELDLIFSQVVGGRFCTRIAVTFDGAVVGAIALAGDAATAPVIDCDACRLEVCAP